MHDNFLSFLFNLVEEFVIPWSLRGPTALCPALSLTKFVLSAGIWVLKVDHHPSLLTKLSEWSQATWTVGATFKEKLSRVHLQQGARQEIKGKVQPASWEGLWRSWAEEPALNFGLTELWLRKLPPSSSCCLPGPPPRDPEAPWGVLTSQNCPNLGWVLGKRTEPSVACSD